MRRAEVDLARRADQVVRLSGPARDLLRGLLPEDAAEAKRAMAERRASGALVLPG
jgi:hypothetical protein